MFLAGVPCHIISRGNNRSVFFFADAEAYLLACYRYIELNPVRASMVKQPIEYRWSSYAVNCGFKPRKNLVMNEVFKRLSVTNEA
jgi:putative transposase